MNVATKDKFDLYGDHGYWLYYNEDGNNGNGQVVEVCIYPCDVLLDAKTENEFWDHLHSVCTTYLHDNGDSDFDDCIKVLSEDSRNTEDHRSVANSDTMEWLIAWAKQYV